MEEREVDAFCGFAFGRSKSCGGFKEFDVGGTVIAIECEDPQQARNDRRPEGGFRFGSFIGDDHQRHSRRQKRGRGLFADERMGYGFNVPHSDERFVHRASGQIGWLRWGDANPDGLRNGDRLKAAHPDDFFNQVDFRFDIHAMEWNAASDDAGFCSRFKAKAGQRCGNFIIADWHADDLATSITAHGDCVARRNWLTIAQDTLAESAAAELQDEFRQTIRGCRDLAGVDAALKTKTGIAGDAEAATGVADGYGIKRCGFDQNICCGICDGCERATLDASDGDGSFGIGDDQIGFTQLDFGSAFADRQEQFIGFCFADDDLRW